MPAKKKAKTKTRARRRAKRRPASMLEVYEKRFEETGSDIAWHRVKVERCSAGKHCACRPLQFSNAEIAMLCDAVHSVTACGPGIRIIADLQRKLAREVKRIREPEEDDE